MHCQHNISNVKPLILEAVFLTMRNNNELKCENPRFVKKKTLG